MESSDYTPVKSNAVVKYSASQSPATFAQLQCNTDLNLPPSNWLSNSARSYGLQYVFTHSTGFSSFRLAHMFPDCVGEVDVVSDAENIKNLLKLPYSHGNISMMVHRVENTLLIDDFDVYKHLLRTAEKEWEWLRKFFYEHIRKSLTEKDRNKYLQSKSRNALKQKSLVSKFLYHSLVEKCGESETNENDNEKREDFQIGPALPDPSLDEEVPDSKSNHKYSRNVVWTFEDIQMLIGTDIPIFGGTTHPCISLRLRDMSSPINVLTGIDYWLDNLMSNVPEVVMCYHLNGIVQKYELIKTEDLPYLENSKFSPSVIRDIAQNILSFLKSNATKAGHTYWLFKGKDDDVVKLYDLTSLCSHEDKDNNPFTVPVAMLLYRVARNMKNSSGRKQLGTIRMLLKNCVQLLSREKYPQIVTSSHYMISDLYVPAHTDPAAPGLEQMETDDIESCYEDDLNENAEEGNMKQLHLGIDKARNSDFVYRPPPPITGSLEERCQCALNHVLSAIECLQYFPLHDENSEELKKKVEKARQREEEDNPKMAKPFQAIPMPYEKLNTENTKKKKKKKKNKMENNNNDSDSALLLKQNVETMPSWQEPDKNDHASWNAHLKTLLYEKACLVYAILAEQDYVIENYGSSLRNIGMLVKCQQILQALKFNSRAVQESCILGRAGDACFMIVKNWDQLEKYRSQFTLPTETCTKLLNEIQKEEISEENLPDWVELLPKDFTTIEQMLLTSCSCYEKALSTEPPQELNSLYRRLGNIQNEIGVYYMNKSSETRELYQEYHQKALNFLQNGIKSFETVRDEANLALLHSNMGRLMRLCAHFHSPDVHLKRKLKGQEKFFYNKALESYQKALQVLGNRRNNDIIWDTVSWELSTALFTRATLLQDYPTGIQDEAKAEKEVVETLQKALQYCDMETPGPRQPIYQYRVACIHQRLASLYHNSYRKMTQDNPRRKNILQLSKLHYERACKLFKFLEQHLDLLKSLLERVALSELLSKNVSNTPMKIRHLQYCLFLLVETIPSINVILEREKENREEQKNKTDSEEPTTEKIQEENNENSESHILTFVRTIEQQLQYTLKMLAKLCLTKTNNKDNGLKISEMYKQLYSLTLKPNLQDNWYELLKNLFIVLNKIQSSDFKLINSDS